MEKSVLSDYVNSKQKSLDDSLISGCKAQKKDLDWRYILGILQHWSK